MQSVDRQRKLAEFLQAKALQAIISAGLPGRRRKMSESSLREIRVITKPRSVHGVDKADVRGHPHGHPRVPRTVCRGGRAGREPRTRDAWLLYTPENVEPSSACRPFETHEA